MVYPEGERDDPPYFAQDVVEFLLAHIPTQSGGLDPHWSDRKTDDDGRPLVFSVEGRDYPEP